MPAPKSRLKKSSIAPAAADPDDDEAGEAEFAPAEAGKGGGTAAAAAVPGGERIWRAASAPKLPAA
jgi:hypothetical protein